MRKVDGDRLDRLVRKPEGDVLTQDESGLWRGVCQFQCDWSSVFRLMPRRYQTPHPDFNNLICDRVSVSRQKPNIALITAEYAGGSGTSPSGGGEQNSENEPVIEVYSTTSQEPIETHPKFTTTIAGTPDAPLWPGVYKEEDGNWVFNKFPKEDNSEPPNACPYFGMTDYLVPRKIVKRTTISTSPPDSTRVGFLESISGLFSNYLKTVHGYKRQGAVYVIEEEWMAPADGRSWADATGVYN